MDGIPEDIWKTWERKRRHTFLCFLFLAFILGLDLSAVFTTMYIYLKHLVRTDEPKLYYSLILGCFNLCSLICCVTLGRWLDKTRKVRFYAHLALVVQIIGYLLYAIPFHPTFLLVGRIFNGVSDTFASVVSGELFRIYNDEDGIRANFWLTAFGFLGVLLGPGISAMFKGFEIHIGKLTINYLNFPGIFLSALMTISLILVNVLVHDCSAEIDLKEYLKNNRDEYPSNETDEQNKTDEKAEEICYLSNIENQTIAIKHVLKCFSTNLDIIVIFLATFISMYSMYSACVVLPLIMQVNLKWDIRVVSIVIVAYGLLGFILIVILGRFLNSSRSVYYTSIFSIICQACACLSITLLKTLQTNLYGDIILLSVEISSLVISWFFADTLLRVTLAKMVPSRIQSFSECLRAGVTRCAIISASFIAPYVLQWLLWWSCGVFVIVILLLITFVIRKKHLLEPQELCFDGYTLVATTTSID